MGEDRGRQWPWGWRRSRRGGKGGALGHGGWDAHCDVGDEVWGYGCVYVCVSGVECESV
jgi:hypothetical protein